MNPDIMITLKNVSKEYRMGTIGGTTLREELQRFNLKQKEKNTPAKTNSNHLNNGKKFKALDDISFEIHKGEAIGIIGHNGAGKSTLLKLITRITAPTSGWIGLNGRIASMLEVGTGFHPELTGKENIYLNGAILGMNKKEIEAKIDQIVDFSEVGNFINTPVKRYSSGMYVKLAFAVAAHLDSEIVIMDEVLAVGDLAFQKKCLDKMRSAVNTEGRTVLYVSHNMNTIRQLCDRCLVLKKGKLIYDGDVEKAISLYSDKKVEQKGKYIFDSTYHPAGYSTDQLNIYSLEILNNKSNGYNQNEIVPFKLTIQAKVKIQNVYFRFETKTSDGSVVGTAMTEHSIDFEIGEKEILMHFDTTHLVSGKYTVDIIAYLHGEFGNEHYIDGVYPGFSIHINENISPQKDIAWLHRYWGNVQLHDVKIGV